MKGRGGAPSRRTVSDALADCRAIRPGGSLWRTGLVVSDARMGDAGTLDRRADRTVDEAARPQRRARRRCRRGSRCSGRPGPKLDDRRTCRRALLHLSCLAFRRLLSRRRQLRATLRRGMRLVGPDGPDPRSGTVRPSSSRRRDRRARRMARALNGEWDHHRCRRTSPGPWRRHRPIHRRAVALVSEDGCESMAEPGRQLDMPVAPKEPREGSSTPRCTSFGVKRRRSSVRC